MKIIGQLNEEDLKAYNAGDKSVVKKYLVLHENVMMYKKWDSDKLLDFFETKFKKFINSDAGLGEPAFKGKGITKKQFADCLKIDLNDVDNVIKYIDNNTKSYSDTNIDVDGDYIQILQGD